MFDAFRAGNAPPEGRLPEIGSSLVRMFIPLTDKPYTGEYLLDVVRGTYPDFTYHFELPDTEWVEPIIEQGSQINLGYCYMPKALGSDPKGPPDDYEAWEEFNYQWALHYNQKYGIDYFEIWNEPDYSEFFNGGKDDYFKMYHYAVAGIKRAVPDARVGGPALAGDMGWIDPFLNYIENMQLPLHFVSYHAQNNGYKDAGSSYHNRYQKIIDALEIRDMDSIEVHLNEFSYEISPSTGSRADRSECAAWFASSFKFMLNNMPRLARFNKTIIDNAEGDGKWENNGLLDYDNTPKAKFNLFKMYSRMPYEGVSVHTEGALDAFAAMSDSLIGVMIWNKSSEPERLNLKINNVPFHTDSVRVYLIDPEHSSYYDDSTSAALEMVEARKLNSDSTFIDSLQLREYSVIQYMISGSQATQMENNEALLPDDYSLNVFPNPFNNTLSLTFRLPGASHTEINIYDALGRRVTQLMNGVRRGGRHQLRWNGSTDSDGSVASGVYYIVISSAQYGRMARKTVYLK